MTFYILLYWHFPVMVMLVTLASGAIRLLYPRLPVLLILLGSGLVGYLYAWMVEVQELAFWTVTVNLVFSFLTIGVVQYVRYLKRKAEELGKSDPRS